MLPPSFEPFAKAAPSCVVARAAPESLFCRSRLGELFGRTARRQYARKLLFSQLVSLTTAVVLRQRPTPPTRTASPAVESLPATPGRTETAPDSSACCAERDGTTHR